MDKKEEISEEAKKETKKTTSKKTTKGSAKSSTNKTTKTTPEKKTASKKKEEVKKEIKQEENKELVKTDKNKEIEKIENENKEIETKKEDIVEETNKVEFIKSQFDGGLLQLIGWKILGFFITILTLGICYPFALCLVYKWQMKHTTINGKRLVFDGKGHQLLGNWIKWLLLSIITLGIYSLWIPVQKNKWIIKHTHYEGTTTSGDDNKSKFTGTTLGYIGWKILGTLIIIFSLGILTPCAVCLIYNWRIKHTVIDGDEMEFDGGSLQLFGLWIKWTLLSIITLGIYSFWIPISILKWETKHTNKKGLSKPYSVGIALIVPITVVTLVMVLTSLGLIAYKFLGHDKIVARANILSKENEVRINSTGETIEPSKIYDFSDGVAWIEAKDNEVYLINTSGIAIYETAKPSDRWSKYEFNEFKDGFAKITDAIGTRIIDKEGNTILSQTEDKYDEITYTDYGFAIIKIKEEDYKGRTEKIGIYNLKTSKFIVGPAEDLSDVKSLQEGMFTYNDNKNRKSILLNAETGKTLEDDDFVYSLPNFSEGYTAKVVHKGGDKVYRIISRNLETADVTKETDKQVLRDEDIGEFGDGLIYIKGAYYNAKGEKQFEFKPENLKNKPKFVDGYALAFFYNGNKRYYTTIDKNGNFIFEPKEYISTSNVVDKESFAIYEKQKDLYPGAYILARENNKWKVIDQEGKTITELIVNEIPVAGIGKDKILSLNHSKYKTLNGKSLTINKSTDIKVEEKVKLEKESENTNTINNTTNSTNTKSNRKTLKANTY